MELTKLDVFRAFSAIEKEEKINRCMRNKNNNLQEAHYFLPIETINDIRFTPREIDIIAGILSRGTTKKIAISLHISPKTVENHIRNIMQKLECNSRERIIDIIEGTKEAPLLKQRYIQLICIETFEQTLKEISTQIKKNHISCTLIETEKDKEGEELVFQLGQHLTDAGISVQVKLKTSIKNADSLKKDRDTGSEDFLVYILSPTLWEEIQKNPEFKHLSQKTPPNQRGAFLFACNKKTGENVVKNFLMGYPENSEELINYYSGIFEVLQCFLPTFKWDKILSTLKNRCAGVKDSSHPDAFIQSSTEGVYNSTRDSGLIILSPMLRLKYWKFSISVCFLIIFCLISGFIYLNNGMRVAQSDLTLPATFALLKRPELIAEMENKLHGHEGVQTIALVGLAGAGKKVLARQYARKQDAEIVWEINAEEPETIVTSFERLVYTLSKSEEDRQILKTLQEERNPQRKEERLIFLVREKMRALTNWIFIYYNVNDLSKIQQFFPQDFGWGNGKVIITTRDNNIQTNKYVKQILPVGELDENQCVDLFIKILNKGTSNKFSADQLKNLKAFLNKIPPFPLDVSLAAYYIKETKTPYDDYIEYLHSNNREFNKLQENLLKEVGSLEKTRYTIVSLSLKDLIKSNAEYRDLLEYLTLIGSKNILRELLYTYKDRVIVDNFIHDLNKYSLAIVTLSDLDQRIPTFSIHMSIQEIIYDYLKNNLKKQNNNSIPIIFSALKQYTDEVIHKEDSARIGLMLSHCLKFMRQNKNQNITNALKGKTGLIVGTLHYYLGNFLESQRIFEESLAILSSHPEYNSSEVGVALTRLGNLYREFGHYEQAKETLEKGLAFYQKHLPHDYIGKAFILRHLARVYRNSRNYEKAKSLIEKSLALYRDKNPANLVQIAHSNAYLGKLYKDLGRYTEAKTLLQETYDFSKKYYGSEHPRTAKILRDLGQAYYLEGDVVKGEELTERALEVLQKFEHFECFTIFENLAEVQLQKSKNAIEKKNSHQAEVFQNKARSYLQQALEVVQTHFPEDSPHVTRIQAQIAKLVEEG